MTWAKRVASEFKHLLIHSQLKFNHNWSIYDSEPSPEMVMLERKIYGAYTIRYCMPPISHTIVSHTEYIDKESVSVLLVLNRTGTAFKYIANGEQKCMSRYRREIIKQTKHTIANGDPDFKRLAKTLRTNKSMPFDQYVEWSGDPTTYRLMIQYYAK